ncbi:MAG TPA: formimidoylglutamate deiminase [Jatrophihabitans sp.]|nr:formimidoylglutamate deiminase [Jatrophihabitans sp.]
MRYFAEHALLPDGPARDVLFEVSDGRFTAIYAGRPAGDAQRLPGVVLPGLANAHSHVFHRAIRGRTQADGGSFWTWRDRMYAVAGRLDPDRFRRLARATFAEMALAGVSSVGEFHYLHHAPGGARYAEPNVMAEALREAASEAGIRVTLLDTCYLAGGLTGAGHQPLQPVQQRFSDGSAEAWAERVGQLRPSSGLRVGAAVHSVRAVPREQLATVVQASAGRPLHVHLSEQPAENEACRAFYGQTPTMLLAQSGVLGPATTAVHATHLTTADIAMLGSRGTAACFCPTTERDLADGIGPARELHEAGSPLSLGSDQHAVLDLLEEARALELDERLRTGRRGSFSPAELLAAATNHASLGWQDAGLLTVGARADLVAVRTDSVRTAGSLPEQILFSASAADVDTVIVDGVPVVSAGQHRLGDIAALLREAIEPLWSQS